MRKVIVVFVSVLFVMGCLYGGWWHYNQQNSITVVFADAQGLNVGDPVRMSGVDIGEVRDLEVSAEGVDVRLLIDRSARKFLSTTSLFVIGTSQSEPKRAIVLLKESSVAGNSLGLHSRVRGMDSITLWQLSDLSKQVYQIFDEPPVRDLIEKLKKAKADMNRAINNTDSEAILKKINQRIGNLSEKYDRIIHEVGATDRFEEISHSIDEIRGVLIRVSNSKEAKRLRQSLDALGVRMQEEMARRNQ